VGPVLDSRRLASGAATLRERLGAPAPPESCDPIVDPRLVLDVWQAALGAGRSALAARLAWQGLDPDRAAVLVARPLYATGDLPAWTAWVSALIEKARSLAPGWAAGAAANLPPYVTPDEPPFIEVGLAVLELSRERLGPLPGGTLAASALRALEQQLLAEVGSLAGMSLYESFRTFRQRLPPDDLTQSYRLFIEWVLTGGLASLLSEFPVLARHLALAGERWTATTRELAMRLAEDRELLAATFGNGTDLGPVVALDPALSDPHDGRRRVARLTFGNGVRVVYKPRHLGIEQAFSGLLEWANARGLDPSQRTPLMVARSSHGWSEQVSQSPSFTPEAARTYFRHAGGLLCWAHLLRARDLHMENLVATGSGPVAVDLEVLLQPVRPDEDDLAPQGGGHPGSAARHVSCLTTGMVSLVELQADGTAADVGGLRGSADALAPHEVRVWRSQRTPEISPATGRVEQGRALNAVMVEGRRAQPEEYAADLLEGFVATYRFVLERRSELCAPGGPLRELAGQRSRVLARRSHQYAALLQALNTPRFQRDGALRGAQLELLLRPFAVSPEKPAVWPVLEAEQEALERLDVPRFTSPTDETTVCDEARTLLGGYLRQSGYDAMHDRLAAMSEGDLSIQRQEIIRSLDNTVDTRFRYAVIPATDPAAADGPAVPAAQLTAAAVAIGRELLAICEEQGFKDSADAPTGADDYALYRGVAGLPVFFAALACVTGDSEWSAAARAASVRLAGVAGRTGPGITDDWPLGFASGVGSLVYGLALTGRLLRDDALIDSALDAARSITDARVDADSRLDVVDGAAGALLALLSLHRLRPEPWIVDLAERCGRRLETAEVRSEGASVWPVPGNRRFLGFAHGVAGVGAASMALAGVTGRPRWRAMGARAFDTLRSTFDEGHANWPIELTGSRAVPPRMAAWCHGSPGIVLALARALDIAPERAILTQVRAAVDAIARMRDHLEEHVCCGNLGRAEALLAAGRRFGITGSDGVALDVGLRVAQRAGIRRHVRLASAGFYYPVRDSGFFRGLTGVGYQLLRLSAPDVLPSVLAVE
jgi:type 2 lantibiotic biosynthesis protein LanM